MANKDKILSIFEPHTELIKRGKVGKLFEYGHMVQIQQVRGCFITDYAVFAQKPNESTLLHGAIKSHRELFGSAPSKLAADRGYWPGAESLKVAVMGCVVNGPGESKNADIGISLPGTGEAPRAPVFVDGERKTFLEGPTIATDFIQMVEDYVVNRWGDSSRPS